ncbi:fructose bisphosphate aldolase [Marivita geojedonensis]|uniref:fructose-bisphosphate aldolase n=1 Tax=Marivita geojedonensis TaxID=1123756 RepID=A0A1X4NLR8_9RHOB|nr:fructose bisphosphate aldolase [Marivita geojedonensis]OSQ51229.1 fructose-1,6-bisphosphate aldolase [Marivita geojedonensis]PRY78509.1 fructose-bisphosphate aldolase [Marivita geojedonensis]
MTDTAMADRIENGAGFIAALDQSGGSTPKALRLYGIEEDAYDGDAEMFALIHDMRCRIMTAPDFTSDKVLGAILFERTMRDTVEGVPVPTYLWKNRGVVPFLKIDKGLEDKENGAQVMKPMPGLEALLADAKAMGVFGTKERSVIHEANAAGIKAVVDQQFEVAKTVCGAGMVPIIEPEVDINSPTKAEAEAILKQEILTHLNALAEDEKVMLKLTIPTEDGLYVDLADHPNVLRVVALSGGYTTDDACERLARNPKMIASFSRALAEGLSKQQSDDEFNAALGSNIDKIFEASK